MITNSLEWAHTCECLLHRVNVHVHTPENRRQVIKMINNIGNEIRVLSRAEVMSRAGHRRANVEILDRVNGDIDLVEEYLLVAALIG